MYKLSMHAFFAIVFSFLFFAQAQATSPGHAVGHEAKHEAKHEEVKGVAPETAVTWLKNGNTRFVAGNFRKDGRSKSVIEKLSKGQHPHTIVLSCSDSRVPPEHAFDQGLGEIFVIRVAGEAIDSSVVASIEYAVAHLGSKLIVVMGHTHCGAVKAAYGAKAGESSGSPDLDMLVEDIKPRLKGISQSEDVSEGSSQNAKLVATDLIARSKILADKIKSGDLAIKSALYWLNSGKITWLN